MINRKLSLGKLPQDMLINLVLSKIKVGANVLLSPSFGEDGAVIKTKEDILVVAADPITGATEEAGWLAVHVNANDIAVHGAYPKWFIATLLFPPETNERNIELVMDGIVKALDEIDATLIGGHTEITDRVNDVLISGVMIGEPMIKGKFITSSGARDGDAIIITKGVGIEGTYILAKEFRDKLERYLGDDIIDEAIQLKRMISVLPDVEHAINSIGLNAIHAMHDLTEGGLIGGLYEMAHASNLGFIVHEEKIPILKPTKEICDFLKLDPLKLIGSGAILIAVEASKAEILVKSLQKHGTNASIIGSFTKKFRKKGYLIKQDGTKLVIKESPIDELWSFLMSEKLLK